MGKLLGFEAGAPLRVGPAYLPPGGVVTLLLPTDLQFLRVDVELPSVQEATVQHAKLHRGLVVQSARLRYGVDLQLACKAPDRDRRMGHEANPRLPQGDRKASKARRTWVVNTMACYWNPDWCL